METPGSIAGKIKILALQERSEVFPSPGEKGQKTGKDRSVRSHGVNDRGLALEEPGGRHISLELANMSCQGQETVSRHNLAKEMDARKPTAQLQAKEKEVMQALPDVVEH